MPSRGLTRLVPGSRTATPLQPCPHFPRQLQAIVMRTLRIEHRQARRCCEAVDPRGQCSSLWHRRIAGHPCEPATRRFVNTSGYSTRMSVRPRLCISEYRLCGLHHHHPVLARSRPPHARHHLRLVQPPELQARASERYLYLCPQSSNEGLPGTSPCFMPCPCRAVRACVAAPGRRARESASENRAVVSLTGSRTVAEVLEVLCHPRADGGTDTEH